jgi:hypothetical protein
MIHKKRMTKRKGKGKGKRNKKQGGKSGNIYRILNIDNSNIIGAGGYGLVITHQNDVIKLLLDIEACQELQDEVKIHQDIYRLLKQCDFIKVPRITFFQTKPIQYKNKVYLCGIGMKLLHPPLDFTEQVHCCLGYEQNDIDTSWGQKSSEPVSNINPTRGFFASIDTLEYIWKMEKSIMTIEKLAYQMGYTIGILLKNGILPNDVEWVWSDGKLGLIDFGLCEYGYKTPDIYVKSHGLCGLADDIYVPHMGQRGYDDFLKGLYISYDMY